MLRSKTLRADHIIVTFFITNHIISVICFKLYLVTCLHTHYDFFCFFHSLIYSQCVYADFFSYNSGKINWLSLFIIVEMSLMLSSCTVASFLHIQLCNLIPQTHSPSELRNFVLPCQVQLGCRTKSFSRSLSYKLLHFSSSVAQASTDSKPQLFTEDDTESFEREDHNNVEDVGSPWEGAIIYKRNPSITHVEYCTTLERLGLGRLSTEISKSKASAIGLRVTKSVKDYPHGTPVQISIDVTRKKQKLRLDGIIKTVITLDCNRYFIY